MVANWSEQHRIEANVYSTECSPEAKPVVVAVWRLGEARMQKTKGNWKAEWLVPDSLGVGQKKMRMNKTV
jgi:hypothetical protein